MKLMRWVVSMGIMGMGLAIGALILEPVLVQLIVSGREFDEVRLNVQSNNLVDLGVVDSDQDGLLDIFTINHHSRQSLLRNKGAWVFEDVFGELGLDQDPNFPNLEIRKWPPAVSKAGFYLYWLNSGLVLRNIGQGDGKPISGRLEMESSVEVRDERGFVRSHERKDRDDGLSDSTLTFEIAESGEAHLKLRHIAIPVRIRLDQSVTLDDVYIGQDLVNPSSHDFILSLSDRHGMAWADYNEDGHLDVFVTRGGLRGKMMSFREQFRDELFTWDPRRNRYVDVIDEANIRKGGCPGYNTQWVDFDRDGDLDVYVACHHGYPNQLYRRESDGRFSEVAARVRVDLKSRLTDTPFLWFDIDRDGKPDLVAAAKDGIEVYRARNGGFERSQVLRAQGVSTLGLTDFDNDGDLDVYASSYAGASSLLVNDEGVLEMIGAQELGLPAGSLFGIWVDYDNDGFTDVYSIPGGLYRQSGDGTFHETGLLRHALPYAVKRARATWADLDNDGDRDLVLAIYYEAPLWRRLAERLLGEYTPGWVRAETGHGEWLVRAFRNLKGDGHEAGHWMQLRVEGERTNRQAIGALVRFGDESGSRIAQVGEADGSLMSQGHYRIYLGLGETSRVPMLHVTWPDGTQKTVSVLNVNQIITIEK